MSLFIPLKARLMAVMLAILPTLAFADFCELMYGGAAASCRANANGMGATIIGNWLKTKPEIVLQAGTGKRGAFSSATIPASRIFGIQGQGRFRMTIDCFAGSRGLRIQALPYMLGLAKGRNDSFSLTFKVDGGVAFTERWPLNWSRAELEAPEGSNLINELSGGQQLTVTTSGVLGNKSAVGYVYALAEFDQINAALCQ